MEENGASPCLAPIDAINTEVNATVSFLNKNTKSLCISVHPEEKFSVYLVEEHGTKSKHCIYIYWTRLVLEQYL